MLHNLANRIASVFVLYGESTEENADIYAYACEAVLAFLVNLLICIAIALLFGRIIEGIVFIAAFALLRRYTGGYHASAHYKCILIFGSILTCSMILLNLSLLIDAGRVIALVIATIAGVGIFALTSVENKRNPSNEDFRRSSKHVSRWISFILWLFCIINYFIFDNPIGFAISLSMFSVFVSAAYVKISNYFNFRKVVEL